MGAVTMALSICDQRQHHFYPPPDLSLSIYRCRVRKGPPVIKDSQPNTGAVRSKWSNLGGWNIWHRTEAVTKRRQREQRGAENNLLSATHFLWIYAYSYCVYFRETVRHLSLKNKLALIQMQHCRRAAHTHLSFWGRMRAFFPHIFIWPIIYRV